jgi:hypothetical protein
MNHILKDAPQDRAQNAATYSNEKLPLDKELVRTIVAFIKAPGIKGPGIKNQGER